MGVNFRCHVLPFTGRPISSETVWRIKFGTLCAASRPRRLSGRISLLLSCCETRKLKKGSFKETCFFAFFFCVNKERRAFLFVIFFWQSKKMTNMFAYAFTKRRMYETRKLKKGRFKEICFFGSASITKQKMTNVFYLRFYKA